MAFDRATWLLSDGRSGSTWFAQVLDHAGRLRVEHEPVHRSFTPALAGEPLVPLPGNADITGVYAPLFEKIRTGDYRGARFARPVARPAGLVIRDINALLIAPAMLAALPWLRPVVIVRHPAEVAASKWALPQWEWDSDLARLFGDPVVGRYLAGLEAVAAAAGSAFRRHVVFWAACHRFLLAAMPAGAARIVRYPDTPAALAAAVAVVLRDGGAGDCLDAARLQAAWAARSPTDRPAGARVGWRQRLGLGAVSARDLAFAEEVIDAFGLRWLVPWQAFAGPVRAAADPPAPPAHGQQGPARAATASTWR